MTDRWNWAGNYEYSAERLHYPETVEEVQKLVKRCRKVSALGTRHSFNGIADCSEDLVSVAAMDPLVTIDADRQTVTVGGGVRYGQLCRILHEHGFALHNMASLPHISVAGAIATATHGSGDGNRNLAAGVSAMEMVSGEGEVVTLSRECDGDRFAGTVVGLGGLGVVTKVTLDLVPAFHLRQDVYRNLDLSQALDHFDEITSAAYSVSLFTDWTWAGGRFNQVWLKRIVTQGEPFLRESEWFGTSMAGMPLHPIDTLSATNCTDQMGIVGPWHERLPHFRLEYMPSSGEELQSEYLVPRQHAIAALLTIFGLREHVCPALQISEVRTVAADSLWMSPCYRQDCVALHFTWKKNWLAVQQILPRIEEVLAPFDARPHWGKLFTMPPSRLRSLYAKLPEFRQLLRTFDPAGKFRNDFLDKYVFGSA